MKEELLQEIRNHIKISEGLSLMPYEDTHQLLTIGYGRCLDIRGISKDEAEYLFNNDIQIAIDDVRKIVNRFDDLPEQAKIVLIGDPLVGKSNLLWRYINNEFKI